jgi:hypothetical protein
MNNPRRTLIALCACLVAGTMACAAADSKNILKRSDGEATPDPAKYLKLRKEYAERFSGGWFTNPERRALMKLYDTDKTAFLNKAREWLRRCPIDAKIHMMCALLLTQPSQAAEKRYHKTMLFGLMDSLFRSGNGKSCESGYYVININEEYMLLNAIGAKDLGHKVRGNCDTFDVELEGKRTTVSFTMSNAFAARWKENRPAR